MEPSSGSELVPVDVLPVLHTGVTLSMRRLGHEARRCIAATQWDFGRQDGVVADRSQQCMDAPLVVVCGGEDFCELLRTCLPPAP